MSNNEVDNPAHYCSHPSGIHCIEITRHMSFNIGNAIKYMWRCGLKPSANRITDLRKAAWYINDEIQRLTQEQENDRQQEIDFGKQADQNASRQERTVECARCGYDIDAEKPRYGHGLGCPNIPGMED